MELFLSCHAMKDLQPLMSSFLRGRICSPSCCRLVCRNLLVMTLHHVRFDCTLTLLGMITCIVAGCAEAFAKC